ncbi:MAG: hypothetical protein LCI00_01865 [Chloroflexi bacterium]|nr:hypothetical protein [Chloroflexota bacterium]MCC6895564.1 hypothetical protein [Anaerolineae bacterium]
MSIVLATTFNPRGETGRLRQFWADIQALYDAVVISLPPSIVLEDAMGIRGLDGASIHVNDDWTHGRYMALQLAYQTQADYIHYVDMDRLLRWIETQPDELRQTINQVQSSECLVIGRTEAAWETHPQAMRQTEAISSGLFSRLIGQELDLSAGSKGFNRAAVECLLANTQPERAIGADSEWVIICQRAGFKIESLLVDGLDWEIADRYQTTAADSNRQQQIRNEYDADAENWAHRVRIAHEIIEAGMDALNRPIVTPQKQPS